MATIYRYLTPTEYAELDLGVSGITNSALAEKHISSAERMVDAYVRGWPRFYGRLVGTVDGIVSATLTSSVFGAENPGYWAVGGLYLRIAGGAAAGELVGVSDSGDANVTLDAPVVGLAAGDRFTLEQRSVFPRRHDYDGELPYIPDAVKMATAAQVSAMVHKGSEHAGPWQPGIADDANLSGESYGSGYSFQKNARATLDPQAALVCPMSRMLLRRFRSSIGRVVTTRGGGCR